MDTPGLVLFAHGARDARWAEPFERLLAFVAAGRPDAHVRLAFLELMAPSLALAIDEIVALGCRDITVVPVFFGQGGHIRRDLPALLGTLRATYPDVHIHATQAIGEDPEVLRALAAYCLRELAPPETKT